MAFDGERELVGGALVPVEGETIVGVEPPRVGLDGIEHCTCFTAAGMYTPPDPAERIAAAQSSVCPTVGRHLDAPMPPRIQERLERTGLTWELRIAQVDELPRAGVRLISGGDSGINPAKPHGVLPVAVADLLIVDGNPLVDIRALHAVRTVVARGREVDLAPR